METYPGEGVVKEEKFPNTGNPLNSRSVGSFRISEGNITAREKKKNKPPTEYAPKGNSQRSWESAGRLGLNREAWAACSG